MIGLGVRLSMSGAWSSCPTFHGVSIFLTMLWCKCTLRSVRRRAYQKEGTIEDVTLYVF